MLEADVRRGEALLLGVRRPIDGAGEIGVGHDLIAAPGTAGSGASVHTFL